MVVYLLMDDDDDVVLGVYSTRRAAMEAAPAVSSWESWSDAKRPGSRLHERIEVSPADELPDGWTIVGGRSRAYDGFRVVPWTVDTPH